MADMQNLIPWKRRAFGTITITLTFQLFSMTSSFLVESECLWSNSSDTVVCDLVTGKTFPLLNLTSTPYNAITLRGNREITEIEDIFVEVHFRSVTLTNTSIAQIPCNFLSGLKDFLEHLDLGDNRLRSVPTCLFQNVKNISELSLRDNVITEIKYDAFYNLFNLDRLDLSANRIASISDSSFKNIAKLKYLNLSANNIQNGLNRSLRWLIKLRTLDISHNQITTVSSEVLSSLVRLENINLDDNDISQFPGDLLLPNLKYLSVRNNNLDSLSKNVFASSTNITWLDLSGNQLIDFPSAFGALGDLQYLNMSRNLISQINKTSALPVSTIHTLDCSMNKINVVRDLVIRAWKDFEMTFQGNDIGEVVNISVNLMDGTNSTVTISFKDNNLQRPPGIFLVASPTYWTKFTLDVSMNEISTYDNFHPHVHDFNKITIPSEKLSSWYYISHNGLHSLPPCWFSLTSHIEMLDLSFNYIQDIHGDSCIGTGVKALNLSNNNFKKLSQISKHTTNIMETIILEGNHIAHIEDNTFLYLENTLKMIDLRNNELQRIPTQILSFSSFVQLLLDGNLLSCDCPHVNVSGLPEFILRKVDDVRCATPAHSRGFMAKCAIDKCLISSEDLTKNIHTMCKNDDYIGLEFTITPNDDTPEVTWLVYGPQKYSGVRIAVKDKTVQGRFYNQTFHPVETKHIIWNMTSNHSYIVCVVVLSINGFVSVSKCSPFMYMLNWTSNVSQCTPLRMEDRNEGLLAAFCVLVPILAILALGNILWCLRFNNISSKFSFRSGFPFCVSSKENRRLGNGVEDDLDVRRDIEHRQEIDYDYSETEISPAVPAPHSEPEVRRDTAHGFTPCQTYSIDAGFQTVRNVEASPPAVPVPLSDLGDMQYRNMRSQSDPQNHHDPEVSCPEPPPTMDGYGVVEETAGGQKTSKRPCATVQPQISAAENRQGSGGDRDNRTRENEYYQHNDDTYDFIETENGPIDSETTEPEEDIVVQRQSSSSQTFLKVH